MTAARLTLVTLFSVALALNAAWAEPSIYPTGVTRYDPAKAYGTFILFSGGDNKTHLIDMDGREVHRWNYPGFPSGILDPALTVGKARPCHGRAFDDEEGRPGDVQGPAPHLP